MIFDDNSFSIGRTPLVRLHRMAKGSGATVLAKIEGRNPSYSVKCRIGASMVWEATKDQYVMPNQNGNPDNVQAHYETTSPEIWHQTEGRVRYVIAGYGTCGTPTGAARFLKEQNPEIQVIAVEPQKGHRLPGLKNFSESKFREEGLIVGPSPGAIVHGEAEFGRAREGVDVAISPDSGFKYVSFFADKLGNEGEPHP